MIFAQAGIILFVSAHYLIFVCFFFSAKQQVKNIKNIDRWLYTVTAFTGVLFLILGYGSDK